MISLMESVDFKSYLLKMLHVRVIIFSENQLICTPCSLFTQAPEEFD